MRTLTALLVAMLFTTGSVGCNMTRGLGEDIEAAGEGLEEVAEETEEELEA